MRLIAGTCDETSDLLSLHLEGELRGLRRLRVSLHLALCDRCRSMLESLARTVERLRSLGRTESVFSRSVAGAVLLRLRDEQKGFA